MRLLITGAGGMLGQDVVGAAHAAGVESAAPTHAELDITEEAAVAAAVRDAMPNVVINCAAFTDVDGAESALESALAVNEAGAANVARAATEAGAWTVHISTDYVFDGSKREAYVESDPTRPLQAYGRSKLAGELAVARAAPESHTIVRSSWLFGIGGRCFPRTILELAAGREALSVVDDQVGCPTFTAHLAPALVALATARPPLGIIHVAGAGPCTWFELASEIVRIAGLECEVRPCSTADMPRPATRPHNSVLGTERPGEAPELPSWHRGIEGYMALTVSAR